LNIQHVPWIWNVCRNPDYKEKNIGRQLIEYTLDFMKNKYPDNDKIYLYAAQKPVSRTKYYESLGFTVTGNYGNTDPEMVFKLA
jgi:predicted GNAT family N-acyltransferase